MRKHRVTPLWYLLLALGILATGWLLWGRLSAEHRDREACAAMSLEDIRLLARESGLPEQTWRQALSAAGVRYIIGEDPPFCLPEEQPDPDKALALVENHARTGVAMAGDIDPEQWDGPLVKTLLLYEDYANRAVGQDTQEIENLLFRAVTDRGLRLLILAPFYNSEGGLLTDPACYTACLGGLSARLADRGITFGTGFSAMESPVTNIWLILCAGLLPAALGIALLGAMVPFSRKYDWLLCLIIPAGMVVCGLVMPALTQKILMLASAVLFPCWGVWVMKSWALREPPLLRDKPVLLTGTAVMAALTAWCMAGGLSVSALMATRPYMMEFDIFTGVKLAQYLPVAFACLLLVRELGRDLLGTDLRSWLALGGALAVIAGIWLLLSTRSGDPAWKTFDWERTLRNWLEYTLYARPRTKEFLFAAPCVPLYMWACRRRFAPLQLLCGAGVSLQLASALNTFCHAVAPVRVSVIRTLLAVALGLVIGLAITALLELLRKKKA